MKKKFKDTTTGKILKSVFQGALGLVRTSSSPIVGAAAGLVEGIKQEAKKNLNSEIGGKGNVDYVALTTMAIILLLFIAFLFDLITMDELKELIKIVD